MATCWPSPAENLRICMKSSVPSGARPFLSLENVMRASVMCVGSTRSKVSKKNSTQGEGIRQGSGRDGRPPCASSCPATSCDGALGRAPPLGLVSWGPSLGTYTSQEP